VLGQKKSERWNPKKEVFITITYLSRNHKDSHNRELKKKEQLLITKLFKNEELGKPSNWL
jgi:hypothetical protein